jgi:uncharacterized protein (DUF2126 family)
VPPGLETEEDDGLLQEVRAHDAAVSARGVELWIGAEPTFTVRESQDPEWLAQAEGGQKLEKAIELLEALVAELEVPARLVRAQGRQFQGEKQPRFCLAAEWVRGTQGQPTHPIAALLDGPLESVPRPDPRRAWLTVTADPGVLEVNLPPSPDLEGFLALARATYRAAGAVGLSAERFRFNGEATDSGGGGQITLGGPSAEASPFFVQPLLLPAVLRYLQNHPSLSYAFAGECVGSASQGPRPDEGVRERWEELAISLDRLESRGQAVGPEELWGSLAPLLVDASGNSHRAEVNVEKLWNPGLGPRGLAGLVEFRSLRMPRTARQLVAVAALFRSICARLSTSPAVGPLHDWGTALHERWALPFFLEGDLQAVLEDLSLHGVGLGPGLTAALWERAPPLWSARSPGASLEIREALEFWPLLGDVASQETLSARLVDTSTRRLEVRLALEPGTPRGRVGVSGWEVPLERAGERGGREILIGAVRYRAYVPSPGLHPGLLAHDPLELVWEHRGTRVAARLHAWKAEGGPYVGLPRDAEEARLRREQRVLQLDGSALRPLRPPPAPVSGGSTLDLRRLPPD